jgi:hypothetical protein
MPQVLPKKSLFRIRARFSDAASAAEKVFVSYQGIALAMPQVHRNQMPL